MPPTPNDELLQIIQDAFDDMMPWEQYELLTEIDLWLETHDIDDGTKP